MECVFPAVVFIITSMVTQAAIGQRMIHAERIKEIIWKVWLIHMEIFLFVKRSVKCFITDLFFSLILFPNF